MTKSRDPTQLTMIRLIFVVIIATLLKDCCAEVSELEKFLTSGFKKDRTETKQNEGDTATATSDDLITFMRRAGIVTSPVGNQFNRQQGVANILQTLNTQQQSLYPSQQTSLNNYAAPKRQLEVSQQQKQLPAAQSTIRLVSDPNSKAKAATVTGSQQGSTGKGIVKADRQGLYTQDDHAYDSGFSGPHDGYVNSDDGDHHDSYSAVHYAPEYKESYIPHPPLPPPKPVVSIKIDPLNILRILLQGLPKPLLNLNGKVFFGVELGKNAGLVKGVGYVPQHVVGHPPPAKGIVLNLG